MLRLLVPALVLLMALALASCEGDSSGGGGGGDTGGDTGGDDSGGGTGGGDTTAPTVLSVFPVDGSSMLENSEIIVTFSEEMATSFLSVGGDLGTPTSGTISAIWTTTTNLNDTLTISPSISQAWPLGGGQTLTVDVPDISFNDLGVLTLTYDVANVLHVSTSGNDANPGTPEAPMATIQSAADLIAGLPNVAAGVSTGEVRVAAGEYTVDSSDAQGIVLLAGVSLVGGFSASDWAVNDPATHVTTITDESPAGSSGSNGTIYAVNVGVFSDLVIEGFTITGGGGSFSAAISLQSAAFSIKNNVLNGGSGDQSFGIRNVNGPTSATYTFEGNTISGGSGSGNSYGIYNTNNSSPLIELNTIDGGSGENSSNGIYNLNNSAPTITMNNIAGGSSLGQSFGVYNHNSSPEITDNTISGGSGPSSFGIFNIFSGASPVISQNIIDGGDGQIATGIYVSSDALPVIAYNAIGGGSGDTDTIGIYCTEDISIFNNTIYGGNSSSGDSTGIEINSSVPNIRNNTIDGGAGATSIGIDLLGSSVAPSIQNNIVHHTGGGTTICIRISSSGGGPASVENNDLFGCTVVYFDSVSGCTDDLDSDGDDQTCTLAEMETLLGDTV
ncbi:MAG: Ig-like domain-containing protein, partial [SAR324 cluster bacterium]|nr:Ig-like domain-containing protein [SAR324 cluster bacterium]